MMRLINKELESTVSTPFLIKIFCYTRGFLSESYLIYNFKDNHPSDYLSDKARYIKTPFIDYNFGYLIDNKLLFDLYSSNTIKALGLLTSGLLFTRNDVQNAVEEINNYLNSDSGLVIKPIKGGGGFGIIFLERDNNQIIINGCVASINKLEPILSSTNGFMLYKQFKQQGFSQKIYPYSLNTIRILTMIDPISKQPFIPIAVHRFGTKASGNLDNWSNGGLSACIDIESGEMGKAIAYPRKGKLEWYTTHPQTGEKINGIVVPNWHKIKEMILNEAQKISMIPYVGWDVVLSGDQILILEANTNSDVNLLQVHKPLLAINGVKDFFKYHKVL